MGTGREDTLTRLERQLVRGFHRLYWLYSLELALKLVILWQVW